MRVGVRSKQILNDFAREELARIRRRGFTAVTVGNFDGVHQGHRFLLDYLVRRARDLDLQSLAVTLYPNPLRVLKPEIPIFYLTSLPERIALMRESSVDVIAPLTFTPALAKMPATDFGRMLYDVCGMRLLVMGPDHSFGRDREGTAERMRALGDSLGFAVEQLEEHFTSGTDSIHASAIRAALNAGDMASVTENLGRYYSLSGRVVRGEGRGREIGFPTANIAVPPDRFLPAFGVYATWAYLGESRFVSATNIGTVPHFGGTKTTVETFILDFDDDLYGSDLRIELVERISGEEAFTTLEALIAKIGRDVEKTKEILHT